MAQGIPAIMPADFAEVAATLGQSAIRKHYGLGAGTVVKFLKRQTPEWQAARDLVMRDRMRQIGIEGITAAHAGWVKKCRAAKKLPDGFYDTALAMSRKALAEHWGKSRGQIDRMIATLPDDQRAAVIAAGRQRKKEASGRNCKKASAARSEKVRADKPVKKPRAGRPVNWGFRKPLTPDAQGGLVATAADYLRRTQHHIKPICAATVVLGKAGRGFYKVGRDLLPEAAVVDLARAKGFDPDAWRQVA